MYTQNSDKMSGCWMDRPLLVKLQRACPLPFLYKKKCKHTFLCAKDDHFLSLVKKNPNILTIKTVPKRNKVNFNYQKC